MIEIKINTETVKVGNKVYTPFNDKLQLCAMLIDVINLARSGKTFSVGFEKPKEITNVWNRQSHRGIEGRK